MASFEFDTDQEYVDYWVNGRLCRQPVMLGGTVIFSYEQVVSESLITGDVKVIARHGYGGVIYKLSPGETITFTAPCAPCFDVIQMLCQKK